MEFRTAQLSKASQHVQADVANNPSCWCPPTHPKIKLNCDASFSDGSGTRLGIIIHDEKGLILLSASKWLLTKCSFPVGEATTSWTGMQLALDVEFANLVVESNNIQVIQVLQDPSNAISNQVLDDIHAMSGSFLSVTFSHCSEVSNW